METNRLTEAIHNNAAWCNAIAASHGLSTKWNNAAWLSEQPMPRFYPNIVTLEKDARIDDEINVISTRLPPGWGIKDSFNTLDLQEKGFALAFEAHWYSRLPNQNKKDPIEPKTHLKTVKTPSELSRWVSAWGEGHGIFRNALLDNDLVELVYIERDGELVSGLATNQSGVSVGISNVFGQTDDILSCVASVIEKHPARGLVGYGDKAELSALSTLGFEKIGDLRVWLRS